MTRRVRPSGLVRGLRRETMTGEETQRLLLAGRTTAHWLVRLCWSLTGWLAGQ